MKKSKQPIGFTRSCWTCKKFKEAWGGKMDVARNLWHCAKCINNNPREKIVSIEKAVVKMVQMEWKRGKPPAIGWYPARAPEFVWANNYRWWDGERWSWCAFPHENAEKAGRWAAKKETSYFSSRVLWAEMP